jgi:hypothetical protein
MFVLSFKKLYIFNGMLHGTFGALSDFCEDLRGKEEQAELKYSWNSIAN